MIDFAPISVTALPPGAEAVWTPFPGFQERAVAANSDELFIGGAKGPGKTQILIVKPLKWVHKPLFACAFVRESYKELQRALDEATRIYNRLPAHQRPVWNGADQRFVFPSGAVIRFGHARTVKDLTWTQGGNWAMIEYDELGNQPDERVIETLITELRCPDPTIRRQFVGSGNPGFAGHPVMKRRYITPCGKQGQRIAWSRETLPNGTRAHWSRQFVPGRVTDNPIYANDVSYMGQLMRLPDRMKRCLMDGDWDAATGVALDELESSVHIVPSFPMPEHWGYIAAFDWGYAHNAVFMWGRIDDDGRVWVCDTIKRRLLRDWDLASTFNALVPEQALRSVQSGHDCWSEIKARGDNAPQTAEYFLKCGIHLTRANTARIEGYKNLLQHMAWRETEFLPQRQPMVQFLDTPGNRWLVDDHLPSLVMDPDDPRDVLKVDADSETGEGGDDGFDCLAGETLVRTERGMERIDSLVGTSGKCLTPLGWCGYHSVRQTHALRRTLIVTDEFGHRVVATENHHVLTTDGWKQIDEIVVGDQWITVTTPDDHQRQRAGVSGAAILADGTDRTASGRVLSPAAEVAAPSSVRGELRAGAGRPSRPSSGRQQGKQSARKSGRLPAKGARSPASEPRTGGRDARMGCSDSAFGEGVALDASGEGVSLRERQEGHGDAPAVAQGVRAVREALYDDSVIRSLLPPELQDDGATQTTWCAASRVASILVGPIVPTYNMEVEDAECFAVQGGLIVHNCLRYMLAKRRIAADSQAKLLKVSAWDPDVLRRQAEKFMRPVSTPLADRNKDVFLGG